MVKQGRYPKVNMVRINFNEVRTAFIYEDGHAALVFSKQQKIKGSFLEVKWVELVENFCSVNSPGRLLVSESGLLEVLQGASIQMGASDTARGSENTKRLGLAVSSLSIHTFKRNWIRLHCLDDVLSGSWTYQPSIKEIFYNVKDDLYWNDLKVMKIHYLKGTKEERDVA